VISGPIGLRDAVQQTLVQFQQLIGQRIRHYVTPDQLGYRSAVFSRK
jgi:hypothetical protein